MIFAESSVDFPQILDEIKRIDSDESAFLAKLREPLFLDFHHKEIFDWRLECFLFNIFDKNYDDAFMRSSSQITQSRENLYKFAMRQFGVHSKTKGILRKLRLWR